LLERRRLAESQAFANHSGAVHWNIPTVQWESFIGDHPTSEDLTEQAEAELQRYPFRSSTLQHALCIGNSVLSAVTSDRDIDNDQQDELDAAAHPEESTVAPQPLAENPPLSPSDAPSPTIPEDTLSDSAERQQSVTQNAQVFPKSAALDSCNDSHRLSSVRSVEDFVLPYACGYPCCWPLDEPEGNVCFATSKELSAHVKSSHDRDISYANSKAFRCALSNCGKSWKNINGLQYHLQVSKAHFREAISKSLQHNSNSSVTKQGLGHKRYHCPRPGCSNEYKQSSGLRYHLAHGHPQTQPAQLTALPPHLAAKLHP